jgi:hypothetical protein
VQTAAATASNLNPWRSLQVRRSFFGLRNSKMGSYLSKYRVEEYLNPLPGTSF